MTSRQIESYSRAVERRQGTLNRILGRQNNNASLIVFLESRVTSRSAESYSGLVE